MPEGKISGKEKQYVVRLTGLKTGASIDTLAAALERLYPKKSPEAIRKALAQLPLVLLRSAREDLAGKTKSFLEAKGGTISMTPVAPPSPPPVKREEVRMEGTSAVTAPAPPRSAAAPATQAPPGGVERRSKPRVHSGVKLHPMGIGEILDRSIKMLRQNFWLLFLIIFIPQAVFFVVQMAVPLLMGGGRTAMPAPGMGVIAGFGISIFIAALIFLIFQSWSQGALIHAVSETYLGHATSVKKAYGAIWGRLWRLIGTMILMGIIIALFPALTGIVAAILIPLFTTLGVGKFITGLIVFVAVVFAIWGFFYFLLHFLMTDKVVVIEGIGWLKALKRSKAIMKTRTEPGFWKGPKMKATLILLLGFVIAIGIHLAIQIPGFLLNLFMKGSFVAIAVHGILQLVANSLATVFTATALILYYYDIRVRKEGFDLKMMAENL